MEEGEEREEREGPIESLITSIVILCKPSLCRKDYKTIMYNYSDKLIFIKKRMNLILLMIMFLVYFIEKKKALIF